MKAAMDRLYALNKFYGTAPHGSLLTRQRYALVATCGYAPEDGADLLDEALRRLAHHSGVAYAGMLTLQDNGKTGENPFESPAAITSAQQFAKMLTAAI